MRLRFYLSPRMVILPSKTPVLDAARAMENNRIGAIFVQDEGRLKGIVTDRDLSIRVVGQERDPRSTILSEVMTSPLATLSPKDTHEDAIRLMVERNIRRVPLVEDERLVGIVTLDDLILDEAATLDQVASVVEAQLGEGGPAASPRQPARRRSTARAEGTYRRLLKEVQHECSLEGPEEAERALKVVLSGLIRRVTPGEAKDLMSQLPSLLQSKLKSVSPGPDKQVTRESIEADLAQELGVAQARANLILSGVGSIIAQSISPGQLADVQSQLPKQLQEIFPEGAPKEAA